MRRVFLLPEGHQHVILALRELRDRTLMVQLGVRPASDRPYTYAAYEYRLLGRRDPESRTTPSRSWLADVGSDRYLCVRHEPLPNVLVYSGADSIPPACH
ncbi:MAG TPA: hypothetical protein VMM18_04220 [Gemmatimonadaceae bacterium]|nr:hypothetical protein [Gemmatimonadaceae bacterium]